MAENQNRCSLAVYTVNMYTVSGHPPLSTNSVGNTGIVDKEEVEHPFDRASVRREKEEIESRSEVRTRGSKSVENLGSNGTSKSSEIFSSNGNRKRSEKYS
jgi:hypothetical protein